MTNEFSIDLFGKCPKCGRNDGFFNVADAHWFVCHVHGVCWCVGSNLFPCWRFEDEQNWHHNWEGLSAHPYRALAPTYRILSLASPAWIALQRIIAHLRNDHPEHDDSSEERRRILGCLQVLQEWLDAELPKDPPGKVHDMQEFRERACGRAESQQHDSDATNEETS